MKFLPRLCSGLLLTATLSLRAGASNPFRISDDLDKSIQQGLYELYGLNFDTAEATFNSIKSSAPEHPMVAFGMASVHWWRLSVYVLESDEAESRPFLEAVDECVRLSNEKIEQGDPTGEAHLTLGGVNGLLGRWQATNQKWVSAYFTGKKAIRSLRKAMKMNPEMKDAFMGLGMFDYYVATLPSVVRVLAFVGSGKDPQMGLNELTTAANESTYAKIPSKLFLAEIYSNFENKPDKALEILQTVRQELPRGSFIHLMQIIALYNQQRLDDLKTEVANFQALVASGTYKADVAAQGYFLSGAVQFKSRHWTEAMAEYDLAIASATPKDPFLTWSHLYKGYCLDALARRQDAVNEYKTVLGQTRRWGSHDAARKHLEKPFAGTDEDLKKLNL